MDTSLFLACVTVFAIVVYVLADGFDLGIGILFLIAPRNEDRDVMMQSIEPVWDGNETWLVMGGLVLYAAFPPGYYILMPAFYLPVMLMLFGLIARGISFAFRFQNVRLRHVWDLTFAGGSILAAFCQGLILGGVIAGVPVHNHAFAGGPFTFLNFEGLLCGIGLIGGYALLGAGWLIWKTEGSTQVFGREVGHAALFLTAIMMAAVSVWNAVAVPEVGARWFSWPNIAYLAPVPLLFAAVCFAIWRSLWGNQDAGTFVLTIGLFVLGLVGLVVSLWPYVVPRHLTIWEAQSDHATQLFVAIGIVVIIPIVLAYQAHAYWVFRGKVKVGEEDGYGSDTTAKHVSPQTTGLHLS